jgi:hypothetical protein
MARMIARKGIRSKENRTYDPISNLPKSSYIIAWIIHKIVAANTYLSENIKDEIEKSYKE